MSIKIFASKFPNVIVMESYRPKRLTITLVHVSCMLVFCPHFWARCVMLVTYRYRYWLSFGFGNWVLKAEWLLYVGGRPTFFAFFQISKNMTFYVFLSCCTRFLEHWRSPRPLAVFMGKRKGDGNRKGRKRNKEKRMGRQGGHVDGKMKNRERGRRKGRK